MIENDKRINITKGGQILNKRIEELPREIQLKIKSSNISGYEETSLKKQKRQLKYDPIEGDFFNLVTYDGYFLQGIVIRSHVGKFQKDDYMSVVILRPDVQISDIERGLKREHVLLGPKLVDIAYWRKGFFNYSMSFPQICICFKYAFCEEKATESWILENGEPVEVMNYSDFDYLSSYAYTMTNGFARAINRELIINGYK